VRVQTLVYTAAPGEANRLEIDERFRVHDAVPITPQAPCTAVDAQTVTCPGEAAFPAWHITLGDGDDVMTTAITAEETSDFTVDGGDGDDTITAPAARITGGPGNDRLTGEAVTGGPGADVLHGQLI